MAAPRQLDFFTPRSSRQLREYARRVEHGGDVRKGRRKLARPFDRKRPLHLTLRSSRAKGEWSPLRARFHEPVRTLAYRLARANGVRIYQYANSGNHLHLLIRAKDRHGFQTFLRTFAALVPRLVTGAKKGNPLGGKFWDALAWTKIVNWGRQFFSGKYYVIQNELEAEGLIPHERQKGRRHAPS